nr:extended FMRFamide-like protein [Carausius morosus]
MSAMAMLLTSAVMLWLAAAMLASAPGVEAEWRDALLVSDARDDALARVGRSSDASESHELEPGSYARLDRGGKAGNFVRLGRWRPDSFVRLGRPADGPLHSSFLRFGRPADSFIRFGRDKAQNYIRFGRNKADGFIRLGRGGPGGGRQQHEEEEGEEEDYVRREARGGQTGTPRIRSRKVDEELESFQRPRRTGGAAAIFGRGKLTDSNFIRLGRSSERVKRSTPDDEDEPAAPSQSYFYGQLAGELPTYVLGPELSLLPLPADSKRQGNYIRFG